VNVIGLARRDRSRFGVVNVVMLPYFTVGGGLERVPGARQVPCMTCQATLTATPTSLEAAGDDGGFLCKLCATAVLPMTDLPLSRPTGADTELRAAGLDGIADDDTELLHRLQGLRGVN